MHLLTAAAHSDTNSVTIQIGIAARAVHVIFVYPVRTTQFYGVRWTRLRQLPLLHIAMLKITVSMIITARVHK